MKVRIFHDQPVFEGAGDSSVGTAESGTLQKEAQRAATEDLARTIMPYLRGLRAVLLKQGINLDWEQVTIDRVAQDATVLFAEEQLDSKLRIHGLVRLHLFDLLKRLPLDGVSSDQGAQLFIQAVELHQGLREGKCQVRFSEVVCPQFHTLQPGQNRAR